MKAIIVGGTGFLGYYAGLEFLRCGHTVTALGLPPLPLDEGYLKNIRFLELNFETAADSEILNVFDGQEALVFAAGADDRITPKKPAYPFFHYHNVEVVERILRLAKEAGIKRAVVLGSYFVHFNRIWSERKLAEHHPYIRSRVEQEEICLGLSSDIFKVIILELPYIFGGMKGRTPLWQPLVAMARTGTAYFCSGGTNCISIKSVAEAIVGAAEKGAEGEAYLVGDENLTWEQMFKGFGYGLGKNVKVITLPKFMLQAVMLGIALRRWFKGLEGGLNSLQYVDVQTENTFFDPTPSQLALGYSRGNLEQAFKDTVDACS